MAFAFTRTENEQPRTEDPMKSTFLVAALVFGTTGAALAQPPPSPAPAVNLFGSAGAYDGGDNQGPRSLHPAW